MKIVNIELLVRAIELLETYPLPPSLIISVDDEFQSTPSFLLGNKLPVVTVSPKTILENSVNEKRNNIKDL